MLLPHAQPWSKYKSEYNERLFLWLCRCALHLGEINGLCKRKNEFFACFFHFKNFIYFFELEFIRLIITQMKFTQSEREERDNESMFMWWSFIDILLPHFGVFITFAIDNEHYSSKMYINFILKLRHESAINLWTYFFICRCILRIFLIRIIYLIAILLWHRIN